MKTKEQAFSKGDIVGQLTVVRRAKEDYVYPNGGRHVPRWVCKCSCGNTVRVLQTRLRSREKTNCGECDSVKVGKKYGKLKVEKPGKPYVSPKGVKMARWVCRCTCGNTALVHQGSLTSGKSTSCGCARVRTVKYKGRTVTLRDVARKANLAYNTLYERVVVKGQDVAEAISALQAKAGITTEPGSIYNYLTVVRKAPSDRHGNKRWHCKCKCGTKTVVQQGALRADTVKSCGCIDGKDKRGLSNHPLYRTCVSAIARCGNKVHKSYERYGARGITVHESWRKDIAKFLRYLDKHLGKRPQGHTMDRIDNNKGYQPGNLRWATTKMQMDNRSTSLSFTYKGKTKSLADWCKKYDVAYKTVYSRLFTDGWSFEKAIETPVVAPVADTYDPEKGPKFTYRGKTKYLVNWCKRYKIKYSTVHDRIFVRGWGFKKALTTPSK